jgi:hypothetical protein
LWPQAGLTTAQKGSYPQGTGENVTV